MANVLSGIQTTSFDIFHSTLAGQPENYKKLGRVIETDAANLQLGLIQGGTYFTEYTAAAQTSGINQDVLSGKVVFASKAYAQTHRVSFKELRDNPQLAGEIAMMLAKNAGSSINKLPFDGLCALNAVDHPLVGSAINQIGTKKVFDTDFYFSQGATGEGTQSNKFTSPLSRTALEGDLQALFNWKGTATGIPAEITAELGDLVMVTGATNAQLARQLQGSALSGSDMQQNTLRGMFDLCEAPLTRADDYYLISRKADFCGTWIRQYPMISVLQSENGFDAIFAANFIANFWFSPEGAGAIAHIVG